MSVAEISVSKLFEAFVSGCHVKKQAESSHEMQWHHILGTLVGKFVRIKHP